MPASTPCLCCGYHLDGLSADSRCPECATPIRDTLRGVLSPSPAPYAARLRSAGWLLTAAAVLTIALPASIAAYMQNFYWNRPPFPQSDGLLALRAALMWAARAADVLWALALWRLTTPAPPLAVLRPAIAPRRTLRAVLAATALATAVEWAAAEGAFGYSLSPALIYSLEAASAITIVALFVSTPAYIAVLADRTTDAGLARRARRLRWLLPALALTASAIYVLYMIDVIVMPMAHLSGGTVSLPARLLHTAIAVTPDLAMTIAGFLTAGLVRRLARAARSGAPALTASSCTS